MKCLICEKNLVNSWNLTENTRKYRCGNGSGTLHCLIFEIKDESQGWILADINLYLDKYQIIINCVQETAMVDEAFWLNGICYYNTAITKGPIALSAIAPIDSNIQERVTNYLLLE